MRVTTIQKCVALSLALGLSASLAIARPQDSTQQQSGDALADAARKARENKKTAAKPKKVFTDDDLAGKRRQAVRFVAVHTDEASAVRNCSGDASCGARDVMIHRAGVDGDCAPEKLRSAKDQQAHSYTSRSICSSNDIGNHQLCGHDCEPERLRYHRTRNQSQRQRAQMRDWSFVRFGKFETSGAVRYTAAFGALRSRRHIGPAIRCVSRGPATSAQVMMRLSQTGSQFGRGLNARMA
jgi:hypothetical protein